MGFDDVGSLDGMSLQHCVTFSMQRYILEFDGDKAVAYQQKICESGICEIVRDAPPFQAWNGQIPLDLLRPFGRCYGPWGMSVPCPRNASAILSLLNQKDG